MIATRAQTRPSRCLASSPLRHLPRETFQRVISLIPEHDSLCTSLSCGPVHQLVRERFPDGLVTKAFGVVSSVERLLWVQNLQDPPSWLSQWNSITFDHIASVGQVEVMQHALQQNCSWHNNLTEGHHAPGVFTEGYGAWCLAANSGNVQALQFLKENGCGINTHASLYPAQKGDLVMLDWMRVNDCLEISSTDYEVAAAAGGLMTLQWLRANASSPEWSDQPCLICCGAAEGGHLDVLKWLVDNGCSLTDGAMGQNVCSSAAKGGHFDVLQWLRANGCEWDSYLPASNDAFLYFAPNQGTTCSDAALGGHLDLLKWLKVNGCEWHPDWICHSAASGGHLATLEWLTTQGCKCENISCTGLAMAGHLEVLRWAVDQGCICDYEECLRQCFRSAVSRGDAGDANDHMNSPPGGKQQVVRWLQTKLPFTVVKGSQRAKFLRTLVPNQAHWQRMWRLTRCLKWFQL